jgi:hypothetical protein
MYVILPIHTFSEVELAQNVTDLNHLMLNEFFPKENAV